MTEPLRSVVTGAANGIGAAIARRLTARGDRVVGIDRDGAGDLVVADLSVPGQRVTAAAEAVERLGGIDVLVNVAGIFGAGSILDSDLASWRRVWGIDLEAPLELMRLLAPGMARQGFGRIVNITSVHARRSQSGCLAYDVAKAGLEAGTRSAALDLAGGGVLVNAVAPGFVRTAMSELDDGRDETETAEFSTVYLRAGKLPLGRGASADEIAPPVEFLTGRDNSYITGQVITVDGGLDATF